ncbi:MSC_0620 family F1-like ATPase-associated subunit [Ureaplasma canigenitalium]|uniref:MSC_0620 family F1-like ATPase-associated subunit n=1 Tax=Ureaplasma canigenitalium TaxID=42092 RepID=UPI0004E23E8C|nr:hypothetical protein [Ureaplasma canigenitalium]
MNKKWKKLALYSTLILPILAVAPVSLIAAGESTDNKPKDTPGQGKTSPGNDKKDADKKDSGTAGTPPKKKQKILSPEFDTFKRLVPGTLKEAFEKGYDEAIKFFEAQRKKLLDNKEIDFKSKIAKILYFNEVLNFLYKNKEAFLKDPKLFGVFTIFPNIIANNKEFTKGKIKFDGKNFEKIVFGEGKNNDDYESIIRPNTDDNIEKFNEKEKNFQTAEEFKATLKGYANGIANGFRKFVFDEKKDDFKIDENTTLENLKDKGLSITPPKGYKDWDSYFKERLSKEFTKFDLDQNVEFTKKLEEDEPTPEQPKPPKPPLPGPELPPTPPAPPLIPEDNDVDTTIPKLAINTLQAWVKSEHTNKSADDLIAFFNSAKPIDKISVSDQIFFFDNPINTSYSYQVNSLTKDDKGNVTAIIQIAEKAHPERIRFYAKRVLIDNRPQFRTYSKILETTSNELRRDIFEKFYKAVGLDETYDIRKLRNKRQQDHLFSMISAANQVYTSKDISSNKEKTYLKYVREFTETEDLEDILQKASYEIKYEVLTSLAKTRISNILFWILWQNGNASNINAFRQQIKQNKEQYMKAFQDQGKDIYILDDLLNYLDNNNNILLAKINARPFDYIQGVSEMLDQFKVVNDAMLLLSELLTNVVFDSTKEENRKMFEKSYTNASTMIKESYHEQANFFIIFGSITLALSAISLVATLAYSVSRMKLLKSKKNVWRIMIAIAIVSALIICIGIALIAIGV